MIQVDLERMKIALIFSHPKDSKAKKNKPKRYTLCNIVEIMPDGRFKPLIEGQTKCSAQDNFDKARGRKLALKRALCQHVFNPKRREVCRKCGGNYLNYIVLRLTRADRETIWRAYHDRDARPPKSPKDDDSIASVEIPTIHGEVPLENKHGLNHTGVD